MKRIIFVISLAILSFVILSCKKKFKQPYLPKGWYVGEFIYDSVPEKNFKDSFFCNRDLHNQQYEFITLNIFDSINKSIQYSNNFEFYGAKLIIYNNIIIKAVIQMHNIYLENYNSHGDFKLDSLTGKFSLIYMP